MSGALGKTGLKGDTKEIQALKKKKISKNEEESIKKALLSRQTKKANMFLTTDQCADLFVSTPRAF